MITRRKFIRRASVLILAVAFSVVLRGQNFSAVHKVASWAIPSTASSGPAQTGLKGWWKADAQTWTNGASMTNWVDSSSSHSDMWNTTGSNRPVFKTNQVNGLPAVTFAAASSQWLSISNAIVTGLTSGEIFAVAISTAYPSVTANNVWYWPGDVQDTIYGNNAGYVQPEFMSVTSPVHPLIRPSTDLSKYHMLNWTSQAGGFVSRWNNVTAYTDTTNTVSTESSSNFIGKNASGTVFFDGAFAEILFYGGALSSGDRAATTDYLLAKYNIKDGNTITNRDFQLAHSSSAGPIKDTSSRTYAASAFVAYTSYSLNALDMRMGRFNTSVTGNVHIDIYATSGTFPYPPTGSPLGSSSNVDLTTLTGSGYPNGQTPCTFTFSSPVALTAGTRYSMVAITTGFSGAAYTIACGTTGNDTGNASVTCSPDLVTWGGFTFDNQQFFFRAYGN